LLTDEICFLANSKPPLFETSAIFIENVSPSTLAAPTNTSNSCILIHAEVDTAFFVSNTLQKRAHTVDKLIRFVWLDFDLHLIDKHFLLLAKETFLFGKLVFTGLCLNCGLVLEKRKINKKVECLPLKSGTGLELPLIAGSNDGNEFVLDNDRDIDLRP